MGGGGKGGTTTSSQTVSIPPEVLARYNSVNARAETTAEQPFQQYGGEFVAPLTPTQQAGTQATNAAAGQAQPYYGAATALTLGGAKNVGPLTQGQIGYYQNPYTQAVVNPTVQALQQQQGQQLAEQQAQAIKGGAFGGDRANLQRSQLQGQQNLALGQAIAPLYQQGYGQAVQTAQTQQGVVASDLARQMQAGQQVAGLGTGAQQASLQGAQAQLAAGQVGQQTQQAQDTAQYQQFLQERGYPFQVAQFLANIAMGTGALSGSTTSGTQTAPGGFFSDKRLKNDVKEIGETHDGQPIYSYKYNGDDRTQIGLMAQDVEKKHPDAVGLMGGYKTVDYKKATEGAERTHKDMGGGLMPQMLTPEMEAGDTTPSVEMSGMTPENANAAYNSSSPNPTYGWGPRQDTAVALRGSWRDLPASRLTNTPDDRNYSGSEAMRNAPGARYGRAMGGGLVPDGFDPNSMGGAVSPDMAGEAFMRGGYVAGGLVDSNDWSSIVAANKQALGMYGGQQPMGGAPGATGIVPAATIHVPKPIEAAKMSMPAQRPGGLSTAMQTGKDIAGTYSMGKAGLIGSAKTAADPEGAAGLIGGQGKWGGQNIFSKAKDWLSPSSESTGGLIVPRHAYADGGGDSQGDEAVPYDPSDVMGGKDPMEGVLKAGSQHPQQLKAAQLSMGSGGPQGGGLLGAAKDAAGLFGTAKMLGEGASWLGSTAIPFLFAADGGRISAYADGGLIPRQGYATQGATDVPADYSPEADMPSPNAQEAGLVVEKPRDTGSLFAGIEDKYGLPSGYLNRAWQMESSAGQDMKSPDSSARGHFQFIKGTQNQMGLKDPYDLAESADAAGRYAAQNKKFLQLHGVEEPSAGHLYLAHQQGPLGAVRLLNAKDRPAGLAVGNDAAISGNAGDPNASGSAFANQIMNKFAGIKGPASGSIPEGAPRPPGVMGGTDARATSSGAEGKKSIGDVVTSEGFIVPALGFLGSMLASNRPNLGQALGEGIMGGVGAYQSQRKMAADIPKTEAQTKLELAQAGQVQQATKNLRSGMYVVSRNALGEMQLFDKENPTAPVIKLTDKLGRPLPGREDLANEAKKLEETSGATSASGVQPGQLVSDPTKLTAKPTDVNKWTPTLSMPENYIAPNVETSLGVNPATGEPPKDAEKITTDAQNSVINMEATARSQASARLQLNQLIQQFDAIPQDGWTSTGAGNAKRNQILAEVNGILGVLGAEKIAAPAQGFFEAAQKGTFSLGTKVANSIGTREPGYIVSQAVKSQPGTEMSKKGIDIVTASMLAQNDYDQDKAKFYRDYVSRFHTLEGADKAFEHYNPVKMYADRGLVNSISQPDKQKLTGFVEQYGSQYPGRTQQAIQAFEKEHGLGTAKLVLGR